VHNLVRGTTFLFLLAVGSRRQQRERSDHYTKTSDRILFHKGSLRRNISPNDTLLSPGGQEKWAMPFRASTLLPSAAIVTHWKHLEKDKKQTKKIS
jgi:hypothetical protein